MFYTVACREGCGGGDGPGHPVFGKKGVGKCLKVLKKKSKKVITLNTQDARRRASKRRLFSLDHNGKCLGHPKTLFAPGIQDPLHATGFTNYVGLCVLQECVYVRIIWKICN